MTETLRNQTIGLDLVSLVLVAPLALLAAALVFRGHLAGLALAPAIGAYTSYMFLQYILGPGYTSLPGNNERLFPICLFLFTAGWMVALGAWRATPTGELHRAGRRQRGIGKPVITGIFLESWRFRGYTLREKVNLWRGRRSRRASASGTS